MKEHILSWEQTLKHLGDTRNQNASNLPSSSSEQCHIYGVCVCVCIYRYMIKGLNNKVNVMKCQQQVDTGEGIYVLCIVIFMNFILLDKKIKKEPNKTLTTRTNTHKEPKSTAQNEAYSQPLLFLPFIGVSLSRKITIKRERDY